MSPAIKNLGKAAFAIGFGMVRSLLTILTVTAIAATFGGFTNFLFDAIHYQHLNFMLIGGALAFAHIIWKETTT